CGGIWPLLSLEAFALNFGIGGKCLPALGSATAVTERKLQRSGRAQDAKMGAGGEIDDSALTCLVWTTSPRDALQLVPSLVELIPLDFLDLSNVY
ncbi:3380_t:CDS:2, partial [Acaulospora colombiana]